MAHLWPNLTSLFAGHKWIVYKPKHKIADQVKLCKFVISNFATPIHTKLWNKGEKGVFTKDI